MITNWRSEVPQLLIIVGMLAAALVLWPHAPESFPVHWNFRGDVDRFGGKFEGLLLIPLIATGLYAMMLVLPKFDPGHANYESFRSAYLVIRLSLLVLMAVIYTCMLLVAFGHAVNIQAILPFASGTLLIVLGNVMGKIRPNWFVGVRTPWTLTSRRSWNKTHRLAGWLFVGMGIAIAACGVVQAPWMFVMAVAVVLGSVAWMTIYSYIIWLGDPERLTPAAITPAEDKNQ